jgi:HlyD family secretion protein
MAATLNTNISQPASGTGRRRRLSDLMRDPRRRWRLIVPLLVLIGLAGGAAYYYAVYLPAQTTTQAVLQTTVARRGDIVLSASGSGTLEAANQIDLGFSNNGTLTQLLVKVGDQVKQGDLMAEIDNSSQKIALSKAQQALANLSSASAIASAQQAIATAQQNVQSAKEHLIYLISPPVYYWENEVAQDENALAAAQAAADASPSDSQAQSALKTAQDQLSFAKDHLAGARYSYEKTYIPNNFTLRTVNPTTNKVETIGPSEAEILSAHASLASAQGALQDAQNLYAALTGGNVPADAAGSDLTALEQARLDVKTAQDDLAATQLVAPFAGTVLAVNASVGDSVGSSAVISLADLTKLYVQTYLDPSDYAMFKVGNQANVVFDALPDTTLTGKVIQVDPALVTSSGSSVVSGLVQLDPTQANLLIGMSGSVEVIAGQANNVVIVPLTALHEYTPGKYAVFVVRNGKPTVDFVEVGLQDLVNAEIKSGLQAGDVVSTGLIGNRQQ